MANNKQLQQRYDVGWDVVNALRQTNQTLAGSVMTIHDRNLKLTQGLAPFSFSRQLADATKTTAQANESWLRKFLFRSTCERSPDTEGELINARVETFLLFPLLVLADRLSFGVRPWHDRGSSSSRIPHATGSLDRRRLGQFHLLQLLLWQHPAIQGQEWSGAQRLHYL
jgi:hypothetical protein